MKINPAKICFAFLFLVLFSTYLQPSPSYAFDPFTIKFKFWEPPTPTITPIPTVTLTPIATLTPIPVTPSVISPFLTNIPPAGSDKVIQMVNSIQSNCSEGGIAGRVNASNFSCVENILPPLPPETIEIMRFSVTNNKHYYLQCVGFAMAAVNLARDEILLQLNAVDYISNPPAGYEFVDKNNGTIEIQVGDLPIWDYYTFGHIAYVVIVDDSMHFQVAEGHWDGRGLVQIGKKTVDAPHFLGWLRKI